MWLVGNLKLEVTNYSRELYGPGGVAYLDGGDDDGKEEDMEATPSYRSRKRCHKLYVSIQLCFFDACNLVLGMCLG